VKGFPACLVQAYASDEKGSNDKIFKPIVSVRRVGVL
jgi:hypothetical protein